MSQIEKFDEISYMRALAMMMIITYHSLCFYSGIWAKVDAIVIPFWSKMARFLHAIDLNMFVFISGYLFGYLYLYKKKYHHPCQVLQNKFIRLLVPYCVWGVFMVIVFPSLYPIRELLYGVSHLWFLLMLFGVFAIAIVLMLLKFERIGKRGILIFLSINYSAWYLCNKYLNPDDFLCLTRVLYYLMPFLIGFYCAKTRVAWMMSGPGCLMLPLSLFVIYACYWYKLPIPYGVQNLLTTCSGYIVSISLLIILSKIWLTDTWRKIIQQVEHLSMGIYIFNQISMDAVLVIPEFNHWFAMHWMIGPFLLFIIGFLPPLVLSYIFISVHKKN